MGLELRKRAKKLVGKGEETEKSVGPERGKSREGPQQVGGTVPGRRSLEPGLGLCTLELPFLCSPVAAPDSPSRAPLPNPFLILP